MSGKIDRGVTGFGVGRGGGGGPGGEGGVAWVVECGRADKFSVLGGRRTAGEEFADAGAEVKAGKGVGGEGGGVFGDLYVGVDGEVVEGLGFAGGGPGNVGPGDGGGGADADVLGEGVGAEAAAGIDVAVDGAEGVVFGEGELDPGADGGLVGGGACESEVDPVISIVVLSQVEVEGVFEGVAGVGAAHFDVDVFVAVVVEVGEGDGVAFLEVADAGGGGDVEEVVSVYIPEELVGDGGGQLRVPGTEVEVGVAVVVDVAKVGAHGEGDAVEAGFGGDVLEGSVVLVPV